MENSITKGFTFCEKTHIGRYNGEIWPSTTQLLAEFKLIDYSMVPKETLENKRILGIRVDAGIRLLDECDLDEEHFNRSFPDAVPFLEAYRKFRVCEKFDMADKKVERLVSLKYRFHGQPDEWGTIVTKGPDNYLLDWKCSFKTFAAVGPQTAAYSWLMLECLKIRIKRRFSLLLRPTGTYELTEFKDPNDMQDFLACNFLWHQRVNKYKTLNPEKLKENA